jgi:glycosyltransferase involved in cell wall biosynthesis
LSTTLGVLLPVYNAQHVLAQGVADLLEVLAEWAPRFELVIIDDGSTDDTADIALDLAARYPQVRVLGHRARLGLVGAIQTGLDGTDGRIILIGNDAYQLEPDDLRAAWRLRDIERQSAQSGGSRPPTKGAAAGACFTTVARDASLAPCGRGTARASEQGEGSPRDCATRSSGADGEKLPFARLCQQLGFQLCARATFEQFRRTHALDGIARVDGPARDSAPAASPQPNFLGAEQRAVLGR